MAKFVKQYAHVHDQMVGGARRYVDEVRSRHFPEPDHVDGVEPTELTELKLNRPGFLGDAFHWELSSAM